MICSCKALPSTSPPPRKLQRVELIEERSQYYTVIVPQRFLLIFFSLPCLDKMDERSPTFCASCRHCFLRPFPGLFLQLGGATYASQSPSLTGSTIRIHHRKSTPTNRRVVNLLVSFSFSTTFCSYGVQTARHAHEVAAKRAKAR